MKNKRQVVRGIVCRVEEGSVLKVEQYFEMGTVSRIPSSNNIGQRYRNGGRLLFATGYIYACEYRKNDGKKSSFHWIVFNS